MSFAILIRKLPVLSVQSIRRSMRVINSDESPSHTVVPSDTSDSSESAEIHRLDVLIIQLAALDERRGEDCLTLGSGILGKVDTVECTEVIGWSRTASFVIGESDIDSTSSQSIRACRTGLFECFPGGVLGISLTLTNVRVGILCVGLWDDLDFLADKSGTELSRNTNHFIRIERREI